MHTTGRIVTSKTLGVAVVGLVLLTSGRASLAIDSYQQCVVAKATAAKRRAMCLADERAKELKGLVPNRAKCEDKFAAAIAQADAAAAAVGTACRYIDNGDGTISDLNTLLQWEKKDDAGGLHDKDLVHTWDEAMGDWLSELNGHVHCFTNECPGSQSGFAGYEDWRLPTLAELQTLLLEPYPCSTSPCVSPAFNSECMPDCTVTTCSCTATSPHWSSTSLAFESGDAWDLFFFNGSARHEGKGLVFYVRAVRGGRN